MEMRRVRLALQTVADAVITLLFFFLICFILFNYFYLFIYYCVDTGVECNCNGHGTCNIAGKCVCDQQWTGPTCNIRMLKERERYNIS